MNALEHQLDYVFGDALPEPGAVLEVSAGLFWVRMPLPFALNHINLWLVRDELDGRQGWTIIDCGISSALLKQYWEQILDTALDGLPVLRVLVTHCHPDHLGLAQWLCTGGERARWDVRLWMTLGEYMSGQVLASSDAAGSNSGGPGAARHFVRHGVTDEATLAAVRARKNYYSNLVPAVPGQYRRLREGQELQLGGETWRVITGFGHSPEHCALYCAVRHLLISGDMVLPRISTNVSVFDAEPEGNPLGLYLESLERYAPLPADTLVLPSHGKPFRGLHVRLEQLRAHHAARLDEVRQACAAAPQSAAQIVPIMFRRELDDHQLTFAMGEAIAHLNLLWLSGELVREADAQGVLRFSLA
jgi:glyoxylase-like metal-dependent hydrolase (beta-lactamase superfamily II)